MPARLPGGGQLAHAVARTHKIISHNAITLSTSLPLLKREHRSPIFRRGRTI